MPRKAKVGTPNLTGRGRVKRSSFNIKVNWSGINPKIDRDSFRLDASDSWPSGCRVFIDANHKRNWQRLDLGTKADLTLPSDLELDVIGNNPITLQIRVVHPEDPGLLIARSAPLRIIPEKEKPKAAPQSSRQLLFFARRPLEAGIPTQIEFPTTTGGPVRVLVNEDCVQLQYALDEEVPQYMAYIIPPYVCTIAHRLVSDCMKEAFDPSDPGDDPNSPWQNQWNHLFKSWSGSGLQDIDYNDDSDVTYWINDILRHWALASGNPAADIRRGMGGY